VSDLAPEHVLPLLRGRLGNPYRYVESCTSTQKLLGDADSEGTTVVTDHQTQGRGRLGRTWEDVPGRSILMSVLLRPTVPMPLWPELSLVAGEAVAAALRETGIDASLRHPNDVVVAGRKLVGVLAEASSGAKFRRDADMDNRLSSMAMPPGAKLPKSDAAGGSDMDHGLSSMAVPPARVVLGIGVNVNQMEDELPRETVKPPTSLRIELGREVERAPLLASILSELERGYDRWLKR
jgi:BirA family biotin operon repressor/biotin-[acetyl-CoA-carboxylase] ligase